MKFLKKLGKGIAQGAMKAGPQIPVWGPIIAAFIPGKKDDVIIAQASGWFTKIVDLIVGVEAMAATLATPLTGPEKLNAIAPQVTPLVMQLLGVTKREQLDNPAQFDEGVKEIISGICKCIDGVRTDELPDVK